MKILSVEAIPILVPLKQGLTTKTAHGEHIDSPYVIVRIHTDEGLVGLGEATLAPRWSGETSASCVAAIEQIFNPMLMGKDPTHINQLRPIIDKALVNNPFTKAAVEMGLWDIAGKVAGLPLCQLLGGPIYTEIPIKMVVGAFPVEKAVALAEKFLDWGVLSLKVKVGLDPQEDLERVSAVHALANDNVTVGIDANGGWKPTVARDMLNRLTEFELLFAEQPIAPTSVDALAELRKNSNIPIMADESVFTLSDAWNICTKNAADILSIYPGKHGGISNTLEIANVAHAAGLTCHIGSNLELGIGTAAMLQVAATSPHIDSQAYPADLIGPLYHETDLLKNPLQLGPEVAKIPEGPGLGVELDEKQLEQWRVD
ncbi:MAG: enolase C-terminal domain-like protein [Candidatus Latescibacterota bacterium]|nr:enolase C-terminal domain-like protein [Candidatus Latescibacterota bacterium]